MNSPNKNFKVNPQLECFMTSSRENCTELLRNGRLSVPFLCLCCVAPILGWEDPRLWADNLAWALCCPGTEASVQVQPKQILLPSFSWFYGPQLTKTWFRQVTALKKKCQCLPCRWWELCGVGTERLKVPKLGRPRLTARSCADYCCF